MILCVYFCEPAPQTRSRSVQSFLHSTRVCPTDHDTVTQQNSHWLYGLIINQKSKICNMGGCGSVTTEQTSERRHGQQTEQLYTVVLRRWLHGTCSGWLAAAAAAYRQPYSSAGTCKWQVKTSRLGHATSRKAGEQRTRAAEASTDTAEAEAGVQTDKGRRR